jgi:uncharacterized protein (DUF1786 family)
MSRFLLIDIGAGTMDILYYDDRSDLYYKAVVKSPVRYLSEKVSKIRGNLLVTGDEMGGGPISTVLKQRAQTDEVIMSVAAAATIHHNQKIVESYRIKIVQDSEAEALQESQNYTHVVLADLDIKRIRDIVKGFGVNFAFDTVGICAQDHGMAPDNVSHLDFRHEIFRQVLDKKPFAHALLYQKNKIPERLNRLNSIAKSAERLPGNEIYVMDSGMAAIVGACTDIQTKEKDNIVIMDLATSHTLVASLKQGELAGFFEYHTHDITPELIDSMIQKLCDGKLSHKQILKQGGHGAYIRKAFGFKSAEIILATGPKRNLIKDSQLPIIFGSPLGDNMMTGTAGLLEAIRFQK